MEKGIYLSIRHTTIKTGHLILLVCLLTTYACTGRHTDKGVEGEAFHTVAQCRQRMAQARQDMADGHTDMAMARLDTCIQACTSDARANDTLANIVSDAIVMLNNAYQMQGRPDSCVAHLQRYALRPTPLLRGVCRRDLAVVTAYAMSRTESTYQAALLMDQALRMKSASETHQRLFRDYAYAAAVYFCVPERQKDVETYGRKGMEEAHLCDNTSGAQWVTSILGYLYKRNGDLASAVEMYSESYDEAIERDDTLGQANACNNMADLLSSWHLNDKANQYASHAVSIVEKREGTPFNPMVMVTIYTNKAKICREEAKTDSALIYLDKAQEACATLPYNSGQSDVDLIRGSIYSTLKHVPLQRQKGLELLDKVARQGTEGIRCQAYYAMARAWRQAGAHAQVANALDSMYAISQRNDIIIDGSFEFAIDYALRTDDVPMLKRFAQTLNNKKRLTHMATTLKKVSASIVKFDTDKKERELALQASELHRKSGLYIFVILLLVLIASAGSVIFFIKQRMYRIQRLLMEEKLNKLSASLESAISSKEEMRNELQQHIEHNKSSADATTAQPTAPSPFPASASPASLATTRDISIARMRDNDGEARFRQSFAQIHPHFLTRLHQLHPAISRKEELLCMLIVLGKDSAQIEDILCIARSSVNMARYRLRQKLALTRNDNLDHYLQSLVGI